jgi:hypothetical protein
MALHVHTGWEWTSAFQGLGKVKHVKKLQELPLFVLPFAMLGDSWDILDGLMDHLGEFTCTMHWRPHMHCVNDYRYLKMCDMCDKDNDAGFCASATIDMIISPHPPPQCRKGWKNTSAVSVNYQLWIWKRTHVLNLISPLPQMAVGGQWLMGPWSLCAVTKMFYHTT